MTHHPGRHAGQPQSGTSAINPYQGMYPLGHSPWPNGVQARCLWVRQTDPENLLLARLPRKSIVGLYFGQEPCLQCGPLLQSLVALLQQRSKATIIFVSKGTSAEDTKQYFKKDAGLDCHAACNGGKTPRKGPVGKIWRDTIPALVLLDGTEG